MTYAQITSIRVFAFLALSWFVSPWFLLCLPLVALFAAPFLVRRARIIALIAREYQHRFTPRPPQAYIMKNLESAIRGKQFNDHEIATAFMVAMVNSVGTATEEGRTFCRRVRENARRLHFQEKVIPRDMLTQLDSVLAAKAAEAKASEPSGAG